MALRKMLNPRTVVH